MNHRVLTVSEHCPKRSIETSSVFGVSVTGNTALQCDRQSRARTRRSRRRLVEACGICVLAYIVYRSVCQLFAVYSASRSSMERALGGYCPYNDLPCDMLSILIQLTSPTSARASLSSPTLQVISNSLSCRSPDRIPSWSHRCPSTRTCCPC
jgi:hypothetical protein